MNCSGSDPSSTLSKVRDYYLIALSFLYAFFLILCVCPMLKLAKERLALYILISKLCPALIFILTRILTFQTVISYVYSLPIPRQILFLCIAFCQRYGLLCMRLHFIAVATNRAHAVCFPINYAQKINKKVVFAQCFFVHILAAILSSVYYEVIVTYYPWLYLIASFAFYSAIAVKLAWIKASNRNWNTNETAQNSSTDNNSVRITALCFAALIFSLCFTLFNLASNSKWFNEFLDCDSNPIGQQLFYPLFTLITLYYVLDELLLMALCKEMRVAFWRFIRKFVPFWKENAMPTTIVQINRQVRGNGRPNDYH